MLELSKVKTLYFQLQELETLYVQIDLMKIWMNSPTHSPDCGNVVLILSPTCLKLKPIT